MIVERKYGQWITVSRAYAEIADGYPEYEVANRLRQWCAANFLRPVGEVTTRVGHDFYAADLRDSMLILAEVKATGLPPEERLPPNWRTRFRAWRRRR